MTKAEKLKILEKIEKLIQSAGDDSYIAMTFAGIVDICRDNITNDFGDSPVQDLAEERQKSKMLDDIAHKALAERDKLKEDFDTLSAAYRDAVGVARVASFYIHKEKNRLFEVVDEQLPADAIDEQIGAAVRAYKQAKEALRRCREVLDTSMQKPMYYAMKEA